MPTIRLIGAVGANDGDGETRTIAGVQAQVALARLVLDRALGGCTRERLADTIWPGELPATWESALRSVVSRVRAFLTDGPSPLGQVAARDGRYLLDLDPRVVVDLEEARRHHVRARRATAAGLTDETQTEARAALGWLHGLFLPSYDGEWGAGIQAEIDDLRQSSLELLAGAAAAEGDHRTALEAARAAVEHEPLRESAHRLLMRAHASAGNRADALATYHNLRKLLANEVGIEPSTESNDLYVELLGGPPEPDTPPRGRRRLPFVGRRAELERLGQIWEGASNSPTLALLLGELGAGTSSLMVEAARPPSRAGDLVVFADCGRQTDNPFQPVVDLLVGILSSTPDDLQPGFPARVADFVAALRSTAAPPRHPDDHVLYAEALCTAIQRRPTLLLLDDIHLADRSTLDVLRLLPARCPDRHLLLMATADSAALASPELGRVVEALTIEGRLERVDVGGLGLDELRDLVEAVHGSPGSDHPGPVPPVLQVYTESGGNPFLAIECVRAWDEVRAGRNPPAVRHYVERRLAGLPPDRTVALRACALAARPIGPGMVAAATGLDREEAETALEHLAARRLISGTSDAGGVRYEIAHELLRRELTPPAGTGPSWPGPLTAFVLERGPISERAADLALIRSCVEADRLSDPPVTMDLIRTLSERMEGDAVGDLGGLLAGLAGPDPGQRAELLRLLGRGRGPGPPGDRADRLAEAVVLALRCRRLDVAVDAAAELIRLPGARPDPSHEHLVDQVLHEIGRGTPDHSDPELLGCLLAASSRWRSRSSIGEEVVQRIAVALADRLEQCEGPARRDRRTAVATDLGVLADRLDPGPLASGLSAWAAHHRAMAHAFDTPPLGGNPHLDLLAEGGTTSELAAGLLAEAAAAHRTALCGGAANDPPQPVAPTRPAVGPDPGSVLDERLRRLDPPIGSLAGHQLPLIARLQRRRHHEHRYQIPQTPLEAVELALASLVAGQRRLARALVTSHIDDLRGLVWNDVALHTLGLFAIVVADVGEEGPAASLLQVLDPWRDTICGAGYRTHLGPVALHLARLATSCGDWNAAEAHVDTALRLVSARQPSAWYALVQTTLADVLEGRGRAADAPSARALRSEAARALSASAAARP